MEGYRITADGLETVRMTDDGSIRIVTLSEPLSVPPDWLQDVIRVRRNSGDPLAYDFIFVDSLPASMSLNIALTQGDGAYYYYDGTQWKRYDLKFSDAYIRELVERRGILKASVKLIDNLLARIDPADYITSGNAGGQSVSFLTLAEIIQYYQALRDKLLEEDAAASGMNSGLFIKAKRRGVGGVTEE